MRKALIESADAFNHIMDDGSVAKIKDAIDFLNEGIDIQAQQYVVF